MESKNMTRSASRITRPRRTARSRLTKTKVPIAPLDQSVCGIDTWAGRTISGCRWEIRRGDSKAVLSKIDADRFSCVVTSPPYYSQRDYGVVGQIGLEKSIGEYVTRLVDVFEEVKRVLSPKG